MLKSLAQAKLLASLPTDRLPQSLTGQPFPQILNSINVVNIRLKISINFVIYCAISTNLVKQRTRSFRFPMPNSDVRPGRRTPEALPLAASGRLNVTVPSMLQRPDGSINNIS
ncbi:hypothetical protein PSAC2689_100096 [Paraburkholderia sacchari]